jgi:hypothetical protein
MRTPAYHTLADIVKAAMLGWTCSTIFWEEGIRREAPSRVSFDTNLILDSNLLGRSKQKQKIKVAVRRNAVPGPFTPHAHPHDPLLAPITPRRSFQS